MNIPLNDSVVQKRMTLPCVHRGEKVGTRQCAGCKQKKQVDVYQCQLYQECTVDQKLSIKQDRHYKHYPWCVICTEYKLLLPPDHPEQVIQEIKESKMSIQWSYGVTTVWQDTYGRTHQNRRGELLPRTLQSLRTAGFDNPILFVDGCDFPTAKQYEDQFGLHVETRRNNIGPYENWFSAIHELYLRNPRAQRYALFQDDMVTYRNLRQYLDWSPYPQRGYLNLYTFPDNRALCPTHKTTGKRVIGWYPSNQRGFGAVALVFNNESVRAVLTSWHMVNRSQGETPHSSIDGAVVEALRSGSLKYSEYVHHPSLVQHTGLASTMGNGQHSQADKFEGEDYDATELIKRYTSDKVPVPSVNIQLGAPKAQRT